MISFFLDILLVSATVQALYFIMQNQVAQLSWMEQQPSNGIAPVSRGSNIALRFVMTKLKLVLFVLSVIWNTHTFAAAKWRSNLNCRRIFIDGTEYVQPGKPWTMEDFDREIANGFKTLVSSKRFFIRINGKPKQVVFETEVARQPSPPVPIFRMFFKANDAKASIEIFESIISAFNSVSKVKVDGGTRYS